MNRTQFLPQTDENQYLYSLHKVNLTGSEISTILYYLDQVADDIGEAYIPSLEVQSIYRKLEGVVDNYYDVRSCITNGEDYADCVDKLVESMEEG